MAYVTLNRQQWEVLFRPETVMLDGMETNREITDTAELKQLSGEMRLWTEMDDGSIQSGYRFVNRFRYLATEVALDHAMLLVTVDDVGDVAPIARSYMFIVRCDETEDNIFYQSSDGIPYIVWSFADAQDWLDNFDFAEEIEDFCGEWCLMNQMGERFDWEGERLDA